LQLGQPQAAIEAAEAALALAPGGHEPQIAALQVLAEIHRAHRLRPPPDMKAPNATLHYLQRALTLAESMAGFIVPPDLLEALAHASERAGLPGQAFRYARHAIVARKKTHSREAANRACALQLSYQNSQARADARNRPALWFDGGNNMKRKPLHSVINGVPTFFWNPQSDYPPGLEIISIPHLVRRGNSQTLNRSARFEFFMLLAVNHGEMRYSVDFQKIQTRCGTWLLARPGQLQDSDRLENLDGWVICFRPDFLPPGENRHQSFFHPLSCQLADFPNLIELGEDEHAHCCGIIENLLTDLNADLDEAERNGLLLFQLCTLLMRLRIFHKKQQQTAEPLQAQDAVRIAKLRKLAEQHFRTQHSCQWYADQLGCSVKTLGRSSLLVTGKSTKAFLTERIMLEAKRQLIHSQHPIADIASDLGFDEFSNFIKFFRKEENCMPKAFRAQWQGRGLTAADEAIGSNER
jgi:AraC-like DNA-binding protein